MSVKAIEMQMMLTRTNESAKEYNAAVKQSELAQEHLARLGREADAQNSKSVVKTEESPQAAIQDQGQRQSPSPEEQKKRSEEARRESHELSEKQLGQIIGYSEKKRLDIEV